MKAIRFVPWVAVALSVCPMLLAGGLDRYKKWPDSPQGYFMTKAERAEWKAAVKTDQDAEQFIKNFLAKRPPTFAAEVDTAAAMADKHLSVAGQKGSLTLRGKLAIMFGPPSGFAIARRERKGNAGGTAQMSMHAGAGGGLGGSGGGMGVSAEDMNDAALRRNLTTTVVNDYTFTYKGDVLPVKQSKDLAIVVEVNPDDGTDQLRERSQGAQLEQLFEAAAQAKLAPAATK